MSRIAWYRSFHWRIAVGFILFLAGVLAIQGTVLLWMLNRGRSVSGPPPRGFTGIVAADISASLTAQPTLDLDDYLREHYRQSDYPFFVLLRDGSVHSSNGATPPAALIAQAGERLDGRRPRMPGPDGPPGGREGFGGPGPRMPRFGGGPPMGPPEPGRGRFGSPPGDIIVGDRIVGVVSAVPQSPFAQLGPTMAIVGTGLVLGGTALASLLIFGPVRRRLRNLEETATRVGAGDRAARADDAGGDEVAALAAAFNRMAVDLDARALELQAADRARRLLLADVSHELRTPLTAMRGYLETLSMRELELSPDARARYVGIVSEETRRLEYIIGDLLDLARLEGGGDSLDLQDVSIEDLFGRVLERHSQGAESKAMTVTTAIAPGAEIVLGDPRRLEQALQNLAANALRHTPEGGLVELKAEVDGGYIVLSVRDSGPGIPSEHLPFVFERFYKVDPSRAHDSTGSGLGLSIVKAIVERHGGTINVTSGRDRGSIFAIRLPAGAAGSD